MSNSFVGCSKILHEYLTKYRLHCQYNNIKDLKQKACPIWVSIINYIKELDAARPASQHLKRDQLKKSSPLTSASTPDTTTLHSRLT